jgi:hypothetical protein
VIDRYQTEAGVAMLKRRLKTLEDLSRRAAPGA